MAYYYDMHQKYFIQKAHLDPLASMAVEKVYQHEMFPHFCDVSRHLFHAGGGRDKEEALAVATAFFYLENAARDKRTHSGKLPQPIFRAFMSMMFQYTYKGYRDWVLYQTDSNYKQGMIDYLVPQNTGAFLGSANVDVAGILENIKSSLGGGVQVVIQ